MPHQISVLLHTPAYSQVAGPLTYLSEQKHKPGTLVRVPLGQRELLGVVWDAAPDPAAQHDTAPVLDAAKLRPIAAALDALAPLNPAWRALQPATTSARLAKWRWPPCHPSCAT